MIDRSVLVNPLLGIARGGNCLIGPCRPMGLVRLGPDEEFPQPSSGYQWYVTADGSFGKRPIHHFSHTHVAGTGGAGRYGNVGIIPFRGHPRIQAMAPIFAVPRRVRDGSLHDHEEAQLGYYACTLRPDEIRAELTTTRHVGVHRYTFPATDENHVLVNAGAVVQTGHSPTGEVRSIEAWDSQGSSIGGYVEAVSETELVGRADLRGGWGHDKPYSVFFAIELGQPFAAVQLANRDGIVPGRVSAIVCGPGCQALLSFDQVQQLDVRVGISFVSVANARESVRTEAAERGLETVVAESRSEWNDWFDRIRVSGGRQEHREIFYSLFHRLLCMPTDLGVNRENPAWKSGARQFWDYYCLWDSVRNANSLLLLFAPDLARDMLNSLLDIADHVGWLPDAWIAGHYAYMQGGCSASILFAEAAAKGLSGVDYDKALRHIRRICEDPSPDLLARGRHNEDYRSLGYCSSRVPCSVSRHIEYTYHDWCTADLARRLGQTDLASEYTRQAERIWNLWDANRKCFAARDPDGAWEAAFDPEVQARDGWNDPYCYEGTSRAWSLSVLHDIPGLVHRMGGPQAFVDELDRFLDSPGFHLKETQMHYPWLYTFAGRPDRTAERVAACLGKYRNAPDGLPDNEDMGCQSGFYMWASMGLYPLIGQDLYLLTAPRFDRTEIRPHSGRASLTIIGEGRGIHVASASLNGQPIDRAWLNHGELQGVLHVRRAESPTPWARHLDAGPVGLRSI